MISNSFRQLLVIYSLFVLSISLGLFWKYSLQFNLLGVIIAAFGIYTLKNSKDKFEFNNYYLIIPLALTAILRIIPYINNNILLGYDAGIYRYALTSGFQDKWFFSAFEPGFIYLMKVFSFIPVDIILSVGLIIISIISCFLVYKVANKYFGSTAGLFSAFIYSISIIQLKAFAFMYYKNLLAFILLLLILLYLHKRYLSIALIGILGSVHKATFFMFGLAYITYIIKLFVTKKDYKNHLLIGIGGLALMLLLHIGPWFNSILNLLPGVTEGFISPGQSPGTFISFTVFQFSILAYLPLAIIGLGLLIKKKDFNFIVILTIINTLFVVARFFFFNRFIINLDLAVILVSGYGITQLINKNNKYLTIGITILLFAGSILAVQESLSTKPLINEEELNTIKQLQNTETNAYVMTTDSKYSPWVLAYSNRPTIAPGLFDHNVHNKAEWNKLWYGEDVEAFMKEYPKPLYIFVGEKQNDQFKEEECFETYKEGKNKIYKYLC